MGKKGSKPVTDDRMDLVGSQSGSDTSQSDGSDDESEKGIPLSKRAQSEEATTRKRISQSVDSRPKKTRRVEGELGSDLDTALQVALPSGDDPMILKPWQPWPVCYVSSLSFTVGFLITKVCALQAATSLDGMHQERQWHFFRVLEVQQCQGCYHPTIKGQKSTTPVD